MMAPARMDAQTRLRYAGLSIAELSDVCLVNDIVFVHFVKHTSDNGKNRTALLLHLQLHLKKVCLPNSVEGLACFSSELLWECCQPQRPPQSPSAESRAGFGSSDSSPVLSAWPASLLPQLEACRCFRI